MNWLQKISSSVQIFLDKYNKKVEDYILDLAYKSNDRVEKLKNFQIDTNFVINTFQQSNYPEIEQLKLALQNKDIDNLEQQIYHIAQWKSKENIPYDSPIRDSLFNAYHMLRNYVDQLSPMFYSDDEVQRDIINVQNKTKENMEWLLAQIQEAISRITNWRGSSIYITPSPSSGSFGEELLEPVESGHIRVGNGDMSPDFQIFVSDRKMEISSDDIIEDDDFFQNPNETSDYFNLIKEIQSPGSTSRSGKILTLYTARPVEDRQKYTGSTTVPGGLWLTNSFNSAEMFNIESAGGKRDIWKIRINEMYVQKMLDVSGRKDYMVMSGEEVPVKSIELLSMSEDSI